MEQTTETAEGVIQRRNEKPRPDGDRGEVV